MAIWPMLYVELLIVIHGGVGIIIDKNGNVTLHHVLCHHLQLSELSPVKMEWEA
jgi:hypothetical protein